MIERVGAVAFVLLASSCARPVADCAALAEHVRAIAARDDAATLAARPAGASTRFLPLLGGYDVEVRAACDAGVLSTEQRRCLQDATRAFDVDRCEAQARRARGERP